MSVRALVLALFGVSGVSGLIYQVIWARQLTLVFGATSLAITTVLATFMLGLALGSHAAGRWAHRSGSPLRVYACVELGIAAYALAFPAALELLAHVQLAAFGRLVDAPLALGAVRVVLVAAVLLPSTVLMGASLPLLTGALVGGGAGLGRQVGILYGVNTLGAAAGVYLGTFFLIPTVGLARASLAAAGLNAAVGAVAWGCARRWRPPEQASRDAAPGPSARLRRTLLLGYGCSGLAALGYEVVWTRVLVLLFGSSVYAFAVMLAAFLLGLGLGGLIGSRLDPHAKAPAWWAAALQVVIGVAVLAGAPWFDRLPPLFMGAFRVTEGTWWSLTALEFLMALAVMIVPTIAMGATFPLVARLLDAQRGAARAVGDAYAVNTWGAIVGAIGTGVGLIPWLGLRGSLVALAGVNVLAACLFLSGTARSTWWRWALPAPAVALAAGVAALPGWDAKELSSGVYLYADRYATLGLERTLGQQRVLFYREGATATVAVMEGRYRFLRINGKTDAGDSPDNLTQRLLAHVPLLLHPEPHSVLVVGLGTGVTLGTALLHPITHADVVEISPEVVQASRFFEEANNRALADPRTRLWILDARSWLAAGTSRYDVIISEPSNPWQTGNANLFTEEHYRATRARLAPGGIFCQWLPLYRMDEADFRAALRTFLSVFADMTVWFSGGDVLMVGGTAPVTIEVERFLARADGSAVGRSLKELDIADGRALLGAFMLDGARAREYAGAPGVLHTDDYPVLEFSAPKSLYRESAPQILAQLRRLAGTSALPLAMADARALATVYEGVAREKLLLKMPEAALASADAATRRGGDSPARRWIEAQAWNDIAVGRLRDGDLAAAASAHEQAVQLAPDDAVIRLNAALFALHGLGDLDRAERHLREALRQRPAAPEVLVPLATLRSRQGRWAEAEAIWGEVLRLNPGSAEARQGLALAARARHG